MNGYFAGIASRALGRATVLTPRPRSLFERSGPEAGLEELESQRRAAPASRSPMAPRPETIAAPAAPTPAAALPQPAPARRDGGPAPEPAPAITRIFVTAPASTPPPQVRPSPPPAGIESRPEAKTPQGPAPVEPSAPAAIPTAPPVPTPSRGASARQATMPERREPVRSTHLEIRTMIREAAAARGEQDVSPHRPPAVPPRSAPMATVQSAPASPPPPATAATPRRPASMPRGEPPVVVRIERIDIHAAPPAPSPERRRPAPAAPAAPGPSLAEFLAAGDHRR